jgi:Zn-dependent protease
MFGKRVRLFGLLGFNVYVDASWLIIAALITWSLAVGLFPGRLPNLSRAVYWWMGIGGTVGLFLSIVFHEMCHSLVARRYGLPMRGITLFIFGGVAEMENEPANAKTEFLMAAAGPISSFILAGFFAILAAEGGAYHWPRPVNGVLTYLSWLNGVLAVFNLIPAFPLDGGRIFRSALWAWKGRMAWATKIASSVGGGFGLLMIVLGLFRIFYGDFVGGMWTALIGVFLRNAAQASYQQLVLRRGLEGEPIRRFMRTNPVTIPNWISVAEFVDDYAYRYHYKMFPAVSDSGQAGCVDVASVREIPREEWRQHSVRELQRPCSPQNTVPSGMDAIHALMLMKRTGSNRLMVVDNGQLVGIVALRDLLEFLALKLDLEGPGRETSQNERKAA